MPIQSIQSLDIYPWIIGILITFIVALVAVIYKSIEGKVEDMKRLIEKQFENTEQIKYNYLDRFSEVKQQIADTKEEILEKLNSAIVEGKLRQ